MISKPSLSEPDLQHTVVEDFTSTSVVATGTKKPYTRPELYVHGDLRSLTFGDSPGTGESGNGFTSSNPNSWS